MRVTNRLDGEDRPGRRGREQEEDEEEGEEEGIERGGEDKVCAHIRARAHIGTHV